MQTIDLGISDIGTIEESEKVEDAEPKNMLTLVHPIIKVDFSLKRGNEEYVMICSSHSTPRPKPRTAELQALRALEHHITSTGKNLQNGMEKKYHGIRVRSSFQSNLRSYGTTN